MNKVLVIAPKSVAEATWSTEAAKWDHLKDLRVVQMLGGKDERSKAFYAKADVYVINRENVQWLVDYAFRPRGRNGFNDRRNWPFDMIVVDELSSFKNPKSKRFRSLKKVAGLSKRFIGLTGTPAPNGYLDLWPQIYLIDQGLRLGRTLGAYRDSYFDPGRRNGHVIFDWKLKPGAKTWIDNTLKPICLSMSKEDWLSLPPIIYNDRRVRMSREEKAMYKQMQKDYVLPFFDGKLTTNIEEMDDSIRAPNAAVLGGKLLQLANGACYDDYGRAIYVHDRKIDELADIIEQNEGQNVLVFYTYQHDLERLALRFPQGLEFNHPKEQVEKWNNGEVPLMFCHPLSAGHGLNLQAGGHIIVWFGLPWSLEYYQQANARLYRQGQEKPVIVNHIICEDTIDEKVLATLRDKDKRQSSLLKALTQYLTKEVEGYINEN